MKNSRFASHHFLKNFFKLALFKKNDAGFTLIEFTVYIAIIGMMSVLMVGFLWNIVFGSIKEASYQEVQQNARFALTKITQEIKKAKGINSPLAGNSDSALSLIMADTYLDPTVLELIDGKLEITYCLGCPDQKGPYDLTSNQVIVSNLQFTNLSYSGTPGTIQIEMTIEHINPAARIEYFASIDLKSTVSLVQGGAAP